MTDGEKALRKFCSDTWLGKYDVGWDGNEGLAEEKKLIVTMRKDIYKRIRSIVEEEKGKYGKEIFYFVANIIDRIERDGGLRPRKPGSNK